MENIIKLEQKIIDAIEQIVTEQNKDKVKNYFDDITVNEMIDQVFGD